MSLSDYSTKDLKEWDDRICDIAKGYGLDWHEITYEICDYYEMIGHMSYHGMPSHYNHWSFGKTFERTEIGKLIDLDKERSIDVIITRLRKKIEIDPKNPKFLQTIRGAGYVLWIE